MKLNKLSLLAALLIFSTQIISAMTIKGTVVDKETGEPLLGATVMVKGTMMGVSTGLDGDFELKVDVDQTLVVSYISYISQEVVTERGEKELTIALDPDSQMVESVEVVIKANLETEANLQNERMASHVAIENLGVREMSLKGISNVEDGVKTITGISIEDAGQVFVRGLGDRYSLTTMNGLPVASPNPDNKLIPLDLFPSSVVKNITVSKVYTVSSFADYSGALIDIATKDVVNEDFFNISFNVGGTIGTTGQDFYTSDRGSLWKTPKLDPEVKAIDKTLEFREYIANKNPFDTDFSIDKGTAMPDFGFGLSGGKTWQVAGRDMSALVSVSVDNDRSIVEDSYLKTLDIDGNIYKITTDKDTYGTKLSTTALASLNYELSDNSSIGYSLFYSRSAEGQYYNYWCNNDNFSDPVVRGSNSVLHIYQLVNNQINGHHDLGKKLELEWSGSYATTSSDEPDRRQTLFLDNDESTGADDLLVAYTADAKNTIRYFGEIGEDEYITNVNFKYALGDKDLDNSIRLGFNSRNKSRMFDATLFSHSFNFEDANGLSYTPAFSDIYSTDDVLNYQNIVDGNIVVTKLSDPTYHYEATSDIYAAYAEVSYNVGAMLLNMGVRYEDATQGVDYTSDQGSGYAEIKKGDLFPALNLKWSMMDEHSMRLALSKTVTRPSFVEMAPFRYKESGSSGTSVGNENLQNGYNYNADLRYEFFKDKSTDMLSLTAYYKYLDTPIERIQRDAGGDVEYSYQNSESGMAAGIEFEIRKKITDKLRAGFNASYIYTNVQLEEGQGIYTETSRQLQGASPYLLNADLAYTIKPRDESQMTFSLVYNLQGPRIEAVGVDNLCDIMQEAFNTLNFVYSYSVNSKLSIKAKIDNILAQKVRYTQEVEKLGQTITVGEDNTYTGGQIGLTYNF